MDLKYFMTIKTKNLKIAEEEEVIKNVLISKTDQIERTDLIEKGIMKIDYLTQL